MAPVVVLSKRGANFAAGMSVALPSCTTLRASSPKHCNTSMVGLEAVLSEVEQTGVEQELIAQGKGRKRHLGLSDEAIVKARWKSTCALPARPSRWRSWMTGQRTASTS